MFPRSRDGKALVVEQPLDFEDSFDIFAAIQAVAAGALDGLQRGKFRFPIAQNEGLRRRQTAHFSDTEKTLLREFLRSYGPADAALFAGWAGIGIRYAAKLWKSLGDDLVPVTVAGQERSLLAADEDEFGVAQPAEGIVMLPAYDPFLQARDREIITPDTARQKQIWRFNVNPGVVLENGKLLALWRARRSGARLGVEINPYAKISRKAQDAMEKKAGEMAAVLGKSSAELTIGPAPK